MFANPRSSKNWGTFRLFPVFSSCVLEGIEICADTQVLCTLAVERRNVWLPPDMTDCVVFLSVQHEGRWRYGGTAFFLGVPSETENGHYSYLVTAKHNVTKAGRLSQLHVRVNKRDGNSDNIPICEEWTFSEKEASDVAVIPFCPEISIYQYKTLMTDFCATDDLLKEKHVGVGEDLVVVGLFTEMHGSKDTLNKRSC